MAKLRRTLLIGLGGTGIKAILNAKKMFYENYGEIPPMIGFIGIDTDAPGLKEAFVIANDGTKINLNVSEQLCISVDTPLLIYKNNRRRNLFDWIPERNVEGLTALSIGAGQMRSNGRFAITVNENNVKQFINHKITEINNARIIDNANYELLGAETEVHMVFSLGGGTGSGTFLNTAYLIKRMFPQIKISGYAVLSDIFRTMITDARASKVRPNGMGAIVDLDYLAHLTPDSIPVELKWFHTTDRIDERAFDALYFIDNKNENNDMFSEIEPLCEMIALAIVTSVGELGVVFASVSDNVSKLIADGLMDIINKKAWVAGFGCAEIVFDGHRLAKIYERKAMIQLINKMLNGGCDDPSIIANNWLDANKIRENYGKDDVIDYFMSPSPPFTYSDIDDPTNPLPECQHYIDTRSQETQSALDEKLQSLEQRIDLALTHLMREQADRECGIYLCSQILISILHQVELCDGEMKQETKELVDEMPKMDAALKTACRELSDCMGKVLKKGQKEYREEVVSQTMRIAIAKREIARRKMARQFYSWLQGRLNKSVEKVNVIMENLQSVRKDCSNDIQKILRTSSAGSFFQFDLSNEYVGKIECPLEDIVFNNFALFMQEEGGVISLSDVSSKQTEEVLMRFVSLLPKVTEYKSMTIDNAMDEMSEPELKTLIGNAVKKSMPLLPYTFHGFEADLKEYPVECYYVGVANKKTSRLIKNNLFQNLVVGANGVDFSEIGLGNRVIIYRQLGVIPAFTVKALANYENEYQKWETDKPHGSHWDTKLCDRMKKERFRLEPFIVPDNLFETWINAIVYGLIQYDKETEQYKIKSKGMGGKALRGWLVDMGKSRIEAFRFLEDNIDILDTEIKEAIDKLDVPGPENSLKARTKKAIEACQNGTYLQEISQCPISLDVIEHYPEEEELIEKEIEFILDNLAN